MFTEATNLGPLTQRLKNEAAWHDSYPSWPEYADECERLLNFLPAEHLEKFWPRLEAKKQRRDETLNEIRIAWFLDSLGYPVSDWNEPVDACGHRVEFAVSLPTQTKAFVEVKCNGLGIGVK